jgi:hypothetical protein
MGYVLHGAVQGGADTAFDAAMLFVPVVIAAVMLVGPRLLAKVRDRDTRDPTTTPSPAERRGSQPSHHGDEPI